MNHAPTPWHLHKRELKGYPPGWENLEIQDASGNIVAVPLGRENTEHIIKCVNHHDELLDLLSRAVEYISDTRGDEPPPPIERDAYALLRKIAGRS